MEKKTIKKGRGGARPGAGIKSRAERGLEPLVPVNTKVERSVINACQEIHGSLPNALRFAAKHKPK